MGEVCRGQAPLPLQSTRPHSQGTAQRAGRRPLLLRQLAWKFMYIDFRWFVLLSYTLTYLAQCLVPCPSFLLHRLCVGWQLRSWGDCFQAAEGTGERGCAPGACLRSSWKVGKQRKGKHHQRHHQEELPQKDNSLKSGTFTNVYFHTLKPVTFQMFFLPWGWQCFCFDFSIHAALHIGHLRENYRAGPALGNVHCLVPLSGVCCIPADFKLVNKWDDGLAWG